MTKEESNLNGTWLTIYQEFEGRVIPSSQFEGQKLLLQGNTYLTIGAKTDEGIIKAHGPLLDIYGTDGANEGRHYTAIYQVEANKLTICYNLNGGTYPSSLSTEGKLQYFLSVFERAEK